MGTSNRIYSPRGGFLWYQKSIFLKFQNFFFFHQKVNFSKIDVFRVYCINHEAKSLFMFLFQYFSLLEFCDSFIRATVSARWFLLSTACYQVLQYSQSLQKSPKSLIFWKFQNCHFLRYKDPQYLKMG